MYCVAQNVDPRILVSIMDKRIKQFCPKGHNTFIIGRDKKGMCNVCKIIYQKEYKQIYLKELEEGKHIALPRKQFCIVGHDTFICGRDLHGYCNKCYEEHIKNNKEELIRNLQKWMKENPDKVAAASKKYQEEHKEELNEKSREYDHNNREKINARKREKAKENPEKTRAIKILRQTNRDLRVPAWADWANIKDVYHNVPEGMAVDHYIPVQGNKVSGFHVSWNLQYLTPSQNSSKSNKVNLIEISEWYGKILEEVGLKQVIEYAKI